MARPIKTGLDYFSLDVNSDDKIELLEAEHGLEGYAILIKLWQKIYKEGYYIEWNEDSSMLFARKINTEIIKVNSVLNACFKRNLFNEKLYKKYNILTSRGIQKSFLTVCKNAKRKSISFVSEFTLVDSEFTSIITEFTSINDSESTQRKEEKRKRKEENSKENIFGVLISQYTENENLKESLIGFIDMRKSIKKALTERAFKLILNKLNKFAKNDNDKIEILNNSIMNSWQGIFELKANNQSNKGNSFLDITEEDLKNLNEEGDLF